jgi:diadenylate cyclase
MNGLAEGGDGMSKKTGDIKKVGEKKAVPLEKTAEKKEASCPLSTSCIMLQAALEVIAKSKLRILMLYVDGLENIDELEMIDFQGRLQVILIVRGTEAEARARQYTDKVVHLPAVRLTRTGQIKMAVMLSFSKRLLNPNDQFVFLTGLSQGQLDTMMVMAVGREYEMFQSVDQPPLTEHIQRAVFERVLNMSLELAAEGREGQPVGAIFVLGDSTEVLNNCRQNIINPFKGYPERERNILDAQMTETVKEFSAIDGAFVIKGTGVIMSAGTYLLPKLMPEELPQGLGARHVAGAAITLATKSIAITISESTGTLRIWRKGKMITEIEKANRMTSDLAPPTDI